MSCIEFFYSVELLNRIHFYSKSRINPSYLRNIIFLLWHFKTMYLDYYIHTPTTDQIALYKVPQAGY